MSRKADRNLPKSLHTITALANVGRFLDQQQAAGRSMFRYAGAGDLIAHAASVLGLAAMRDVHGLKDRAAAQLGADK